MTGKEEKVIDELQEAWEKLNTQQTDHWTLPAYYSEDGRKFCALAFHHLPAIRTRIAELEEDKETLQSVIDSMQSDLTQLRTETAILNRVINKIKGLNLGCPNDKQIRCVDDDCSECVVRWSRAQAEREIAAKGKGKSSNDDVDN